MSDYRDPTHIDPNEFHIDPDLITDTAAQLAKYIREKMYGIDVRDSLALAVELMSANMSLTQNGYNALTNVVDNLSLQWNSNIKTIDVRYDERIAELVAQFQSAVGGLTTDSEVVNARLDSNQHNWATLKARLDAGELRALTHVPMTTSFETDMLLQISDLTTESNILKYEQVGEQTDFADKNFGLHITRISNMSITEVV